MIRERRVHHHDGDRGDGHRGGDGDLALNDGPQWPAAHPPYSPVMASPEGDGRALADTATCPRCRPAAVGGDCAAWDLASEARTGHGMACHTRALASASARPQVCRN